LLFHDNDSKFTKAVDQDLKKRKVEVRKTAFRLTSDFVFAQGGRR